VLGRVFIKSGARRMYQRRVPKTMMWNQGRLETLSSSRVQRRLAT
jgi:hypothetical protein